MFSLCVTCPSLVFQTVFYDADGTDSDSGILFDGKNASSLSGTSRRRIFDLMDNTNSSSCSTKNDGLIASLIARLDHLEEINMNLDDKLEEMKWRSSRRNRHNKEMYDWRANQELSRSGSRQHRNRKNRNNDDDADADSYF